MNRLWVQISLIITLVAIIITLFPLTARRSGIFPARINPTTLTDATDSEQTVDVKEVDRIRVETGTRVWWITWSTVIFGAIVGLGVGVFLSRSLIRPLVALEQGAKAVAAGDLTYQVPEKGSQETKAVARAFNNMATELRQAQTAQRNMLADIAHELRHPVHIFQGNLQGIIDGVFPLEMKEMLLLAEETRHLSQLVNDLHELVMAEDHELPLHMQEVEINELVRGSIDAVRPLALEKEISLHIELPPTPILLVVDEGRIRQAVQNLLSNAIRYTQNKGDVLVAVEKANGSIKLSVADTGIGIAAADLPYVFDRFYRTDSSRSREQGGTGLGLAITKAIVEGHSGRILASSQGVNQGSIFTILLPANMLEQAQP